MTREWMRLYRRDFQHIATMLVERDGHTVTIRRDYPDWRDDPLAWADRDPSWLRSLDGAHVYRWQRWERDGDGFVTTFVDADQFPTWVSGRGFMPLSEARKLLP